MPRRPHVVLNALFLDPGVSGGPETYLRGLAPTLRELRPDARLTVLTTRRGGRSLRMAGWPQQGIAVRTLPCDDGERIRRQAAEQLLLPAAAAAMRADIVHSLASIAPVRVIGPAHVITLHDVSFIHHATFSPVTTWAFRQLIPRAAAHADGLIADAVASRDDVCATLGLSPDRFTVAPLGVEIDPNAPATDPTMVHERFGLGDARVLLCVGAKRPHKNQMVLLRALPLLPDDLRLVLAGHPEPYEEDLRREAQALGIADRVRFPGWVSDPDLEGLWRVAAAAALPTLGEGFGLPLIEAMARGVPTAASGIPVLREVGGDWPEYFDARDPGDAARAITSVLETPPDPAAGRARAATFTWMATGRATWTAYDRALARRGGGRAQAVG
ncbi:MAG TPA: glycosyltransferase family 1 protein [Solirubrobacteraceae bacterium]|nr:glycosyltransferase family 1 protein [Solirubrobacteraceae bacterium]